MWQSKNWLALPLILALGIAIGCAEPENALAPELKLSSTRASARSARAAEPNRAVHFASLAFQQTSSASHECRMTYEKWKAEGTPRAWVALSSTLLIVHPFQSGSDPICKGELRQKLLAETQASPSPGPVSPIFSAKTKQFLIQLTVDAQSLTPEGTKSALLQDAKLIQGKFSDQFNEPQITIMRALFCSKLGQALVKLGDARRTVGEFEKHFPDFRSSFAAQCLDRELRRIYLKSISEKRNQPRSVNR